MKNLSVLILSGGSGKRFWPLSTEENPKQFLKLFNKRSLIRATFERINLRLSPENIFVVTHSKYFEKVTSELPELPKKNIILEPEKKNTAPAIAYSLLKLPNTIVMIAPADHHIKDPERFWEHVEIALRYLEENHNAIITFGISPSRPETLYGYIKKGEKISEKIYKAIEFSEKPNLDMARKYVESREYLWNSGIFIGWRDKFIEEYKKYAFEVINPFLEGLEAKEAYSKVPSISVDYAVMEKTESMYVVESNFEWSDVGSYTSLEELGYKTNSKKVLLDTKDVYVLTEKPTVVIGVEGIVIVESKNGILITRKDMIDRLKDAVDKVK